MRANAVGNFRFVAVRALGVRGLAQSVMSAAVLRARIGVSSFRIRHGVSVSLILKYLNVQIFQSHPPVITRMGLA
jgi:hypothetical protein